MCAHVPGLTLFGPACVLGEEVRMVLGVVIEFLPAVSSRGVGLADPPIFLEVPP